MSALKRQLDRLCADVISKIKLIELIDLSGGKVVDKDGRSVCECPFHHPRGDVSIVIDGDMFSCSECGFKGSVIAWVMYTDGVDFIQAVTTLADTAELSWKSHLIKNALLVERKNRARIMENVVRDYQSDLLMDKNALRYLFEDRGISRNMIEKFGLGWCEKNVSEATSSNRTLWRYGVLGRFKSGDYFTRFSNRVIFPISDEEGLVLGFGGRSLDDTVPGPKYLNSGGSRYFHKNSVLYGLSQCLENGREIESIVFVEGYMDVIALHDNGYPFAVATLGTAVTVEQISIALFYTDTLYFCFDGDEAGVAATKKAIINSLNIIGAGQSICIVSMPPTADPDQYLKTNGSSGFDTLLRSAIPMYQWLCDCEMKYMVNSRRTSRSCGSRDVSIESTELEIASKVRFGTAIHLLCDGIDTAEVSDNLLRYGSDYIGTRI